MSFISGLPKNDGSEEELKLELLFHLTKGYTPTAAGKQANAGDAMRERLKFVGVLLVNGFR